MSFSSGFHNGSLKDHRCIGYCDQEKISSTGVVIYRIGSNTGCGLDPSWNSPKWEDDKSVHFVRSLSSTGEDNGLELGRVPRRRVKIGLRLAGSHYNNSEPAWTQVRTMSVDVFDCLRSLHFSPASRLYSDSLTMNNEREERENVWEFAVKPQHADRNANDAQHYNSVPDHGWD
ncbi:hypothetical protein V1477_014560 [Vespula maculifrons]|uniref:Uncharacterized protein n=1 Tax=Vespula maculifrons TaxID=7453 RepID=A0ABD2BHT7_VESMC